MTDKPRLVDLLTLPTGSVALDRLIKEVRNDENAGRPSVYDRVYTRHNRS